jgi:RNA polymerase sigma-70 factor (ECF subfamily)
LRRRLAEALATLTEVQRTVVLMHDLEGYRHREIAAELGIPEGTVRSHLFLARRALRQRLGGAYESERKDG